MRVEPMSFGRYRIGLRDRRDRRARPRDGRPDRRCLRRASDADERDPELVAARVQGRAEQHALKSRLAVRRYMR